MAPGGEAGAGGRRPLRVLVIDNEPDNALSLAALLRLWGCEAEAAFGGEEGLAASAGFAPDAVVCDVAMPGTSGLAVAARLSAQPGRRPWLAALSGFASSRDRQRALDAGFDEFWAKPPDIDAFCRSLAELAGRLGCRPVG